MNVLPVLTEGTSITFINTQGQPTSAIVTAEILKFRINLNDAAKTQTIVGWDDITEIEGMPRDQWLAKLNANVRLLLRVEGGGE